eukprot:3882699-Heterocapsa_arctica.AAC.1
MLRHYWGWGVQSIRILLTDWMALVTVWSGPDPRLEESSSNGTRGYCQHLNPGKREGKLPCYRMRGPGSPP